MGEKREMPWSRLLRGSWSRPTPPDQAAADDQEPTPNSITPPPGRAAELRSVPVPSHIVISIHGITPTGARESYSMDVDRMETGRRGWLFPFEVATTGDGGVLVRAGATVWTSETGSPIGVTMEADGSVLLEVPDDFRPESPAVSGGCYVTVSRLSTRSGRVLGDVDPADGLHRTAAIPPQPRAGGRALV